MSHQDTNSFDTIARQIVQYLEDHTHAVDSLKGIMIWWLERRWPDEDAQLVARVLETLFEKGIVSKKQIADGEVIYGKVQ